MRSSQTRNREPTQAGGPCWPWGSHLARYQRANRRGLLSYEDLAEVVAGSR